MCRLFPFSCHVKVGWELRQVPLFADKTCLAVCLITNVLRASNFSTSAPWRAAKNPRVLTGVQGQTSRNSELTRAEPEWEMRTDTPPDSASQQKEYGSI